MNRYLPYINLHTYNSYRVRVNVLKSMGEKAYECHILLFLKSSSPPCHLCTKLQWQDIYNRFKILCSYQQNHLRIPLREISHRHNSLPKKKKKKKELRNDRFLNFKQNADLLKKKLRNWYVII